MKTRESIVDKTRALEAIDMEMERHNIVTGLISLLGLYDRLDSKVVNTDSLSISGSGYKIQY